jgi:hypothetical protein
MSELLSLSRMSRRAGITQQWLREQADAGVIPCLKTGRRYLFEPMAVMEVLAKLASRKTTETKEGGA